MDPLLLLKNSERLKDATTLDFYKTDITELETKLKTKKENYWARLGNKKALEIFYKAAKNVPAYRHFLKKNDIKPTSVKSITDFNKLPITTKDNYIKQYSLGERCWDGVIHKNNIISMSSGTTGKPVAWPRGGSEEFEASVYHELIYRYLFNVNKKNKTLIVICFPMGIYVSGIATLLPTFAISQKRYNISIIPAGNNKAQALEGINSFHKNFDQTIIVGHPFFVKDVVESTHEMGIKWKRNELKLMFCSEGFTETWRDYIAKIANTDIHNAISTYGSSEMLLLGTETPFSINLKRHIENNTKLSKAAFGEPGDINLFQYNPVMRYIEEMDNNLIFTSASGVPLIRYNLKDGGSVHSGSSISNFYNKKPEWELPFVVLRNRSDNTIVFYAANIYPEQVRGALEDSELLNKITGKFVMEKCSTKNQEQELIINIELKEGINKNKVPTDKIADKIEKKLKAENMEYAYITTHYKKKGRDLAPKIILREYQHGEYFKPGLKPRFIKQ